MNSTAFPTFKKVVPQGMKFQLMALYTAAAMHDFDHPGRTNAFLVASEDRKVFIQFCKLANKKCAMAIRRWQLCLSIG